MKNKNWSCILTSAALCFLLSFGGIACLVTAFNIEISFAVLARYCAIASLAGCFLFSSRKGLFITLGILALLAVYLWRRTLLKDQIIHLCYIISRLYNGAYGCGWLGRPTGVESVALALYLWGSLTALIAGVCITRRRATGVAFAFSLAPLTLCLVLTDTIPATGYLIMLLLGLILLLLTRSVRRQDAVQGARLTWMLSLPVALALVALFLANPQASYNKQHYADKLGDTLIRAVDRIPYVDFSPEGHLQFSTVRHMPNSVDLQYKGPNSQLPIPVMNVTAESSGVLYLRGRDYDHYTGTQWSASEDRNEVFTAFHENTVNVYGISPISMGSLSITTSGTHSARYLPYYPDLNYHLTNGTCNNPGNETGYSYNWYALPDGFEQAVYSRQETWDGMYRSIPDDYESVVLSSTQAVSYAYFTVATPYAAYLQLPEDTRSWAEGYLAERLPANLEQSQICQIANAIAGLVRESAVYNLNTPRMPEESKDFARWFMEESDTGYCVHYATATTVLLRAAGIPARYVEGYLAEAVAGKTVTVTEKDAHAWAEYYVAGLGWIPLESTAGGPDSAATATTGTLPDNTTAATDGTTEPSTEPSTAPSTGNTQPSEPPATSRPTEPSTGRPGPGEDDPAQLTPGTEKSFTVSNPVLTVLALLVLLLAQYPIRLRLREKHLLTGTPNQRALKNWRFACRLAKLSHQPLPAQLEELALRAKFSQHRLTEGDLIPFRVYRRETVRQLRDCPWWKKLYHRLLWAAY